MTSRIRTFLDIQVGEEQSNRVVFELFKSEVPKTVENFRALCTGEKGISEKSGKPLWYKGSPIHRIIAGFCVQGGDFTLGSGKGGESIYQGEPFEDEDLTTPVDKPGLLVMANRGPNTNSSQFFVTLESAEHLTGKHTVFGRVVTGFQHIQALALIEVDNKDRPLVPVIVVNSGELVKKSAAAPVIVARKASLSPTSSTSSRSPPPKKRNRSRSSTPSGSDSEDSLDERERRARRKRDKKERKSSKQESKKSSKKDGESKGVVKNYEPVVETEAELDARLEREENERLEEERKQKLIKMKRDLEVERIREKASGGVVYKGRGAMRYLDPEGIDRFKDQRGPYRQQPPPHMRDPDQALRRMMDRPSGGGGGDRYSGRERDGPRGVEGFVKAGGGGRDDPLSKLGRRQRSRSPDRWEHRARSKSPPARRPGLGAAAGTTSSGRGEDREESPPPPLREMEIKGVGRGERRESDSEEMEMEMDD